MSLADAYCSGVALSFGDVYFIVLGLVALGLLFLISVSEYDKATSIGGWIYERDKKRNKQNNK